MIDDIVFVRVGEFFHFRQPKLLLGLCTSLLRVCLLRGLVYLPEFDLAAGTTVGRHEFATEVVVRIIAS